MLCTRLGGTKPSTTAAVVIVARKTTSITTPAKSQIFSYLWTCTPYQRDQSSAYMANQPTKNKAPITETNVSVAGSGSSPS